MMRLIELIPELAAPPLFGASPPFDFETFSKNLSKSFGLHIKVTASPIRKEKTPPDEENLLRIRIDPLDQYLFFKMSSAEIEQLVSLLLSSPGKVSKILKDGFYAYLCSEVLFQVQNIPPFSTFQFEIVQEPISPAESFLCELTLEVKEQIFHGSIFIPKTFQQAWIDYFKEAPAPPPSLSFQEEKQIEVGIQVGQLLLSKEEFSECELGDFLPLHQIQYDEKTHSGSVYLTIDEQFFLPATVAAQTLKWTEDETFVEINELQVELMRCHFSLKALLEKKPLFLPMPLSTEVMLRYRGEYLAKGELISLKGMMGVRILSLSI